MLSDAMTVLLTLPAALSPYSRGPYELIQTSGTKVISDEEGSGTRTTGSNREMDPDKQEQLRLLAIEKKKCDDLMSGEFV